MEHSNKQVDAYIAAAPPFAQPILEHLRRLVHKACPGIQETMKWGMPYFERNGLVCGIAAFRQHCAFIFRKGPLLPDPHHILTTETAMGHLGQIRDKKDLPADKILTAYLKEAIQLNEEGGKTPASDGPKTIQLPSYLKDALSRNKAAGKVFKEFNYSSKKEYIDWLSEAKSEDTRMKRLETAIGWIAEGKARYWKYQKK